MAPQARLGLRHALLACLLCLWAGRGKAGLWSAIASTGSDEDVLEPTTKLSTKERCTADVCFVHKSIPLAASDWEEPAAPRRITVNIFNTQPLSGFSFELVDEDCQRVRVEAAEGGLLGDLQDTFVALGHNLVSMVVYGQVSGVATKNVIAAHGEAVRFTQLRVGAQGRRETCLHNAAAQQGSTQLAVQVLGCRFDPAVACAARTGAARHLDSPSGPKPKPLPMTLEQYASKVANALPKVAFQETDLLPTNRKLLTRPHASVLGRVATEQAHLPGLAAATAQKAAQRPHLRGGSLSLRRLQQHAVGDEEPVGDAAYAGEDETGVEGDEYDDEYADEEAAGGAEVGPDADLAVKSKASSAIAEEADAELGSAKKGAAASQLSSKAVAKEADPSSSSGAAKKAAGKAPSAVSDAGLADEEDAEPDLDKLGAAAAKPSGSKTGSTLADEVDEADARAASSRVPDSSSSSAKSASKAAAGEDDQLAEESEELEGGAADANVAGPADKLAAKGATTPAAAGAVSTADKATAQVPKGANKTTSADAGAAADVNEPAEGEDGADAEESYDFEYDEETGETVEASAVKRRPEDEDEELPAAATKANASASTSEDSVSEALFRDAVPLEGLPLSTTAQTPKSEVKGGFFSTTKEKIFGGGAKDSPAPTETPAAKAEPKPAATVPNVDELDLAGDRSTDTEESESANGESEDMLAVGSTKPPWRAEKNAGDVSFGGKGGKTVSTAASDGMTHSVADTEAVEYVAKKNAEKGGDNLEDAPSNQMRGSPAGLLQAAGQSFINIAIVAGLVIALVVGSVLYFKATSSNPARARVIEIGGGGKGYSRVSDSSGADRPENWDNDWDNDNWDDPDTGRISQRRVKSPEQARRRQDWNNDF